MTNRIESSQQPIYAFPTESEITADLGGDATAQMAAMMFLLSREQSRDASELRQATEDRIRDSQAAQISELREMADQMRNSAILQGVAGTIGASLSFASNFAGGVPQAAMQADSQMVTTVGQVGGAILGAKSTDAQTSATAAEHEAQADIRDLEQVSEDADDARDLRKRVLDFMSTIQEQKAEAQSMAWIKG